MRIAVIGAGIFGCTAALKLQELGDVTIFEKYASIMQCASGINQYRLHQGYHYPRSIETAKSSKKGLESFKEEYGFCLDYHWNEHYYAIASHGSLRTPGQYVNFLNNAEVSLSYRMVHDYDWIENISLLLKVPEHSFNRRVLEEYIAKKIFLSNKVQLKVNTTFTHKDVSEFDVVINATYANLNGILPEEDRVDYQFELCEKPIVQLPNNWARRSIVILDGPFLCLDPYPLRSVDLFDMNYATWHVMGHVEHAIHHRSIGHFPEIPEEYKPLLNRMTSSKEWSNIKKFKKSAEYFFPSIKLDYIGSMYTVRTVLPNHDHDDARPSYITKHSDKLYSIFSGKIGTCVDIANELVTEIKKQ